MSAKRVAPAQPAKPSIAEVLDAFLAEQRRTLAASTMRRYEDIVGLLRGHLDGYAYQNLSTAEHALWERAYNAEGEAHREFCDLFGPEKIPDQLDDFLGYYLIRKVAAGPELSRAAGTVTKKLSAWLALEGHIELEAAVGAVGRAVDASRDLPRAHRAATILYDAAAGVAVDVTRLAERDYVAFDHFTIARVEPGNLWLEVWDGRKSAELGPLAVPTAATALLRPGWSISCALARVRKVWRIVEMANVYPS